jgi:hypothetical protein
MKAAPFHIIFLTNKYFSQIQDQCALLPAIIFSREVFVKLLG